jgi:hypothetical protein
MHEAITVLDQIVDFVRGSHPTGARASGPKDTGSNYMHHKHKSRHSAIEKTNLSQGHNNKRSILIEHEYWGLQLAEFSDTTHPSY